MGKTITIYFDDESLEYIEALEGRGTLINNLIKEHFSNDLDILQHKISLAQRDLASLEQKRDMLLNERERQKQEKLKKKELTAQEQEHKQLVDLINQLWQDGKIKDDDYWSCFKDGKLNEERARQVLA